MAEMDKKKVLYSLRRAKLEIEIIKIAISNLESSLDSCIDSMDFFIALEQKIEE